jgi:hypothetical protein
VEDRELTYRDGTSVSAGMIEFSSHIWFGNSGGPVANEAGELVGVISGGRTATAYAVHCGEIRGLLDTVVPREVFTIYNRTDGVVHFAVRTGSGAAWVNHTLEPGGGRIWHVAGATRVEIDFDHSFAAGYQAKRYDLGSTSVLLGASGKPLPNEGPRYEFKGVEDGIDLFRIE